MIPNDELPHALNLRLGWSTKRYTGDEDFHKAVQYITNSVRASHQLNESQFDKEDGMEHICGTVERAVQKTFDLPIVLWWSREVGKTVIHIDVFFECPNAPFSHLEGARH